MSATRQSQTEGPSDILPSTVSILIAVGGVLLAGFVAFRLTGRHPWQLGRGECVSVLSLAFSLFGSVSTLFGFCLGAGRMDPIGALKKRRNRIHLVLWPVVGILSMWMGLILLLYRSLWGYYSLLAVYSLVFLFWDRQLFYMKKRNGQQNDQKNEIESRLRRWFWYTDLPCLLTSLLVLVVIGLNYAASINLPTAGLSAFSTGVSLSQGVFVGLFLSIGMYQDVAQERNWPVSRLAKV